MNEATKVDPGVKKRRLEQMSNGMTITKQVEKSTAALNLNEQPKPKKLGDTKKISAVARIPAHLRRMMG